MRWLRAGRSSCAITGRTCLPGKRSRCSAPAMIPQQAASAFSIRLTASDPLTIDSHCSLLAHRTQRFAHDSLIGYRKKDFSLLQPQSNIEICFEKLSFKVPDRDKPVTIHSLSAHYPRPHANHHPHSKLVPCHYWLRHYWFTA